MAEETKKKKDAGNPSKWKLFWRIQRECWRRMVTPFLMYMFMSLIALSLSQLVKNLTATIIIDTLCILCGAAFNAHLCYSYGKMHYDSYITGLLHKKNALFGIQSGGNHQTEKEYRVWKGFYIGFLVGVPVILFGALGTIPAARSVFAIIIMLTAWWAFIPASWVVEYHLSVLGVEGFTVSTIWCLPMVLLPIIVSGVFYIIGAYVNKRNREAGKLTKAEETQKR